MQKSSSQNRLCRPKVSKNRLPARIGPKRIVSAHSQKRNSIAGPGPSKMRNVSSKRLPVRIWPKMAVFIHSQKRNSIAGPGPSKRGNLSSKRAPGQDLIPKGRFGSFPEKTCNSRPHTVQKTDFELQKGSRPGFGPKGPFRLFARKENQ